MGAKATFNVSVDPRDLGRYKQKDYLAKFPVTLETEELFLADVAQHLDPAFISALFRYYPKLRRVLMTGVMPSEALYRLPSMHPDLYDVTYLPEGYVYSLEGNLADNYVQPYHSLEWLRTGSIDGHAVTRLDTIFAHHLWAISRDASPVPRLVDQLHGPDAIVMPQAVDTSLPLKDRLLPREVWLNAIAHSRHLKTFQVNDA